MESFHHSFLSGPRYAYMGNLLAFLVKKTDTDGGLTITEFRAPRGSEPPPHVHEFEHEIYYITGGEVSFHIEGVTDPIQTQAGQLVLLPQGKAHTFVTHSPDLAGLIITQPTSPDQKGIADYFEAMETGETEATSVHEGDLQYIALTPENLAHAAETGVDNGILFLREDEIPRRLPSLVPQKSS